MYNCCLLYRRSRQLGWHPKPYRHRIGRTNAPTPRFPLSLLAHTRTHDSATFGVKIRASIWTHKSLFLFLLNFSLAFTEAYTHIRRLRSIFPSLMAVFVSPSKNLEDGGVMRIVTLDWSCFLLFVLLGIIEI